MNIIIRRFNSVKFDITLMKKGDRYSTMGVVASPIDAELPMALSKVMRKAKMQRWNVHVVDYLDFKEVVMQQTLRAKTKYREALSEACAYARML